MRSIAECSWDLGNIASLAKWSVTPDEAEEAILGCDGEQAFYKIRRVGEYYQIFGETGGGRLLAMVGEFVEAHTIRIFHAKDMTPKQHHWYRKG